MKIVHLAFMHDPMDSRILRKECISLAKNDYEVTYITSNKNKEIESSIVDGVNIITLPIVGKNKVAKRMNYYKKLYKLAREIDADIYHIHEPDLLLVGNKLAKNGKKIIFDAHEDYYQYKYGLDKYSSFLSKIKLNTISYFYWRLIKHTTKKCEMVIAAGESIAEKYIKMKIKTKVLNNYPILNKELEKSIKSNYFERKSLLCYVGGVNQQRRIGSLLDIFEEIEFPHFIYAGPIHPSLKEKVTTLTQNSTYRGIVNKQQMDEIYNESTAGVIILTPEMNHYDIQSNKLFEYMEVGLPVICSNFPKWKAFIEKNNCGISVNPLDKKEIKEAILYLHNNRQEAFEMGKRGRLAVLNEYNWSKEEDKLITYYSELYNM